MGMMIAGRWTDEDRIIESGAFVRPPGAFSAALGADHLAALTAEPERFCLIASLSCPWSHRTTLVRALKGVRVPLQIAHGPRRQGYPINGGQPWILPGSARRVVHLHQVYAASDPAYSGRVTVPLFWDSATRRIISNESAVIVRAFDALPAQEPIPDFTLLPEALRDRIEALNSEIQEGLSEAVYRAGLAREQSAYDRAVARVFEQLDRLDCRLTRRRYLLGAALTEADWRLFATLVRFDAVYHTHFRCTRRRLIDYAHLWAYTRDLLCWRGVAGTVDVGAIREGYYANDGDHNPFGIIAAAPDADWNRPHGREHLGPAAVVLRNGDVVEVDPATLARLRRPA